MQEWVPEGESVKEWTQMITVTGAKDLANNQNGTHQRFVESMAAGYRKACPSSFSAVTFRAGKMSGYDAFSAIVSCGSSPLTDGRTSEAAMIMAIKAQHDYYTIQWAHRGAASATSIVVDAASWTQRFRALAPIKICALVPGEAAPYPSCVG